MHALRAHVPCVRVHRRVRAHVRGHLPVVAEGMQSDVDILSAPLVSSSSAVHGTHSGYEDNGRANLHPGAEYFSRADGCRRASRLRSMACHSLSFASALLSSFLFSSRVRSA